jgi:hypothetical protein
VNSGAVFLLDLENVPKPALDRLPADARVVAFVNVSQKSVPRELLDAATELKERFRQIDVVSSGAKNAMDFHIAWCLGDLLAREPDARCVIVSGDAGFDALVGHLNRQGRNVRRAKDVAPCQLAQLCARAQKLIAATPTANRPRTRARLENKLRNDLKAALRPVVSDAPGVTELIEALLKKNAIAEEGGDSPASG